MFLNFVAQIILMTFQDSSETVNKINKHSWALQALQASVQIIFFTSFFTFIPRLYKDIQVIFNTSCTEQWLLLLVFMFPWIQEAPREIRDQLYVCGMVLGLEKYQGDIMRPFRDN